MVEPDLMKHWEYCYVHSVGCVGILKTQVFIITAFIVSGLTAQFDVGQT